MKVERKCSGRCLVVKFGGSSLADESKLGKAARAVAKEAARETRIVVVVSAMGKTTDLLIGTAEQSCEGKISKGALDDLLSMGERISARVFTTALKTNNVNCRYLDPAEPDWPIITDGYFNNAKPVLPACQKLVKEHVLPLLDQGTVVVVPGFIGKTEDGKITTMGRGGSDTTAFILAKALRADQVILVTNVDGIMTADPKIIKNPKRMKEIHANTLVRLADSGTKFIHKKALKYKDPNVDVKVINQAWGDLNSEGTKVYGSLSKNTAVETVYPPPTMSITIVGEAISETPEILQKVFQRIKNAEVPIHGVSIDYNSLILYLSQNGTDELLEALHVIVLKHQQTLAMAVRKKLAFIQVKGAGLEETPGIVSRMTEALYSERINIFGIFTITSSVLVFVDAEGVKRAVKLIRKSIKANSHTMKGS
jgi:aspartate kinase